MKNDLLTTMKMTMA